MTMTTLKWFAGGSERRCEAMTIINHLLEDIKDTPQLTPLKNQLVIYQRRLKDDGTSTPFILSQMNVDISRVLIDNKLILSENQAEQIKKLRELSAIRYGY
ncbi:bacteriocin immunity protein [Streptococcus mitis]|uniref:Bacteriocin immunity protein n=2 Tax=Streptococcus mitis TaxID=28037 RepID=A0A1X1JZU9_STRMT|nr:bacteriocin immunity protein [Streptococcus mitis]